MIRSFTFSLISFLSKK